MGTTPFYVAGRPETSDDVVPVHHPYDGREVGRTSYATPEQVERAVAAAAAVADEVAGLPAYRRAAALEHVSQRLAARAEDVARLITAENGKPLRWSRAEVGRAVSTFRWAAEEARRFSGELQRLDTDASGAGRLALVRRVPRGPVLLAETDLPAGAFSVLPVPNDRAAALVTDPRLPVVSFTGSGPVGWFIREQVPRKHVTLELGGNAAAVVCADWSSTVDLDWAADRIATYANYQAGQSCIAVQRVIVHSSVYDAFVPRLVAAVAALRTGDPFDESTDVGPLIDETAAKRVEGWVAEAVAAGARVLAGGSREGTTYPPTVLTDVPRTASVWAEEVFGPVLVVTRATDDEAAFEMVNDSAYGLQVGVFTRDVRTAFAAHRNLRVGGVIVGDVPSYRADQMPYGGTKGSGVGREGVRSAMDDYTEPRVLVLTGLGL